MARTTFAGEKQLNLPIRVCDDMVRRGALTYNPAASFKATYLGEGRAASTARAILPVRSFTPRPAQQHGQERSVASPLI